MYLRSDLDARPIDVSGAEANLTAPSEAESGTVYLVRSAAASGQSRFRFDFVQNQLPLSRTSCLTTDKHTTRQGARSLECTTTLSSTCFLQSIQK